MPRVSIVMPSYNHELFVEKAIDSVLSQSYQDFEFIIVDDGSSDATVNKIKQYSDPRIKFFAFPKNLSACVANNYGIKRASGEFVAHICSDDVWHSDKLAKQVEYLDSNPHVMAVFTRANLIDDFGNDFLDSTHPCFHIFDETNRSRAEWLSRFFFKGNCLCHPSLLARRVVYDEVGLFNERLANLPDLEFWVRLCLLHDIYILDEKMVDFRIRAGEANASGNRLECRIRGRYELKHVIDHYKEIADSDFFVKVFPNAAKYGDVKKEGFPYLLARLALDSGINCYQLWAIDTLFDLMSSQDSVALLQREYGFSYSDLIKITGAHDVFNLSIAEQMIMQEQNVQRRSQRSLFHKVASRCKRYFYAAFRLAKRIARYFWVRTFRKLGRLLARIKHRCMISRSLQKVGTANKKIDVIFLSIINWNFRTQRPQHLARKFIEHGSRVFYVSVDFEKAKLATISRLDDNLYEVILPFSRQEVIYNLDLTAEIDLLGVAIDRLYADFEINESLVFVEFPLWYPLAKYLKDTHEAKVIFDCLDEYSEFENINADVVSAEMALFKMSDKSLVTSKRLYEKNRQLCANIRMIRNAAEFERFSAGAANELLSRYKRPIIGYFGAISDWFDVDLISFISQNCPSYTFVLIGYASESIAHKLKAERNVVLLGEKPYHELPGYLALFDVCLIPFKICDLIKSTDPVKFYEYLSAGKPVVSTMLPELLPYSDLLYLSENEKKFLDNIEKALVENDQGLAAKRVEFARNNSWEARYRELTAVVEELFPLVSVIVVTYNSLEYTKGCIDSIYAKTAYPNYELIIVDNASHDGTVDYLRQVKDKHDNVKLILNDDNTGFAAANNAGINIANGKYIILLNNDTIVTRGWINGLTMHLQNPAIGEVGPVTNSIGNEAQIKADYKKLSQMDEFAKKYTVTHANRIFDIKVLAMFCVALRKETIDKIGLLDESYGIGMFEDDDYSMRIREAGLRVVCAEDVFIHHFGKGSFGKLANAKYEKIFNENKAIYEKKWGKWEAHQARS